MNSIFLHWKNRLRLAAICIVFAMAFSAAYPGGLLVQAKEQETQNIDVENRTGLEDIIFIEETCDDEMEENVALYSLDEELDSINVYSSEAAAYWKSMGSDYIYSQLSDREKMIWDDMEELCIRYAETTDECKGACCDGDNCGDTCCVHVEKINDVSVTVKDGCCEKQYCKEACCEKATKNSQNISSQKIRATIGFQGKAEDGVIENAKEFTKVFFYSHPQYFFLSNVSGIAKSYNESTGITTCYPLIYAYEDFWCYDKRRAAVAEYKDQIDAWSAEVNACDTVVAKEKKAMEIIADNTIYSKESSLNQSTYSMVCEGKTVCAGYCGTFAILMNRAGIETQVITGRAEDAHGWDTVKVHGIWYLVDPTWADKNDNKQSGYYYGIVYQYLNRADSTISIGRTRDAMWEKYYHPASYDSGRDGLDYVDPYFVEGDYKYFTVNNNDALGTLYALPLEALNGTTIGAAPSLVLHEEKQYSKYLADWKIPHISVCVDSVYDCEALLSGYASDGVVWSTSDATVATVEDGIVTTKKAGDATISATVGGNSYSFSFTVSSHLYETVSFEWEEDGSSCIVKGVCSKDPTHIEYADCTIKHKIIQVPTCTNMGISRYSVTAFGITDTKEITDVPINKNNHDGKLILEGEKAPTVNAEGFTGNLVCDKCGAIVEKGQIIEKLSVGWVKMDDGWRYYDTNGAMQKGWQSISGKWYYFNASGAMVTGWQSISDKWYYFNASGAMVTGWQSISDKWYYFNASGAMVTGWQSISDKWYYFNASGAMVTGWQSIGGKWYYFNASGAMVTGWQKIINKWYYFETSGAMAANKWIDGIYYVKSSGVMATSEWIGKYYVGADGKYVPGKTR